VWQIRPSVYPPWQAAAHRARCLVPTPHPQLTRHRQRGPSPTLQSAQVSEVVTQRRVTKRLAHPVCTSSCWFGNQGHDYLGPRDFCCVVTTHGELLRETVPSGTPCTAASHADRGSPRACWQGRTTALRYQGTKFRKAAREKDVGPTHGFTASPKVGPGATIDTLQTGFPCIQALSWDKGQDVRSCTPVCLVTLDPDSWLGAAMCPVAPAPTCWFGAASEPPHVPWL
jgi:hypothetical protein